LTQPQKKEDTMNRRELLGGALAASAGLGLGRVAEAWPGAQDTPDTAGGDQSGPVVCGLDVATLDEVYLGMLKKGGVNCWHRSAAGFQIVGEIYRFLDEHPGEMTVATTVREIREAYARDMISIVFGTQSAEFLEPDIQNLPAVLRGHYQLGLRILGIAYNLPNAFGSGNFYPYMGLTDAGKMLVEEIHGLNMILDVGGHTGEQTSLDAIAMAPEIPVICSHTNVAAIADNPRCVSDRLIEAVAGTGGVVGLTAVNDFHVRGRGELDVAHSPRVGLDEHIDQMDHIRRLVGVDHIGIGPDFVYGRDIDYDLYNRTTSINRAIISDGPWLYIEGFEDISRLPNVISKMAERGWSKTDIDKVMGGNWLRVYEKVWGG
jgi:membrane dipeptidase